MLMFFFFYSSSLSLSLIVSKMCDVIIPPKNETLSAVDTDTAFSPNENLDSIIILKGVILTVLVE